MNDKKIKTLYLIGGTMGVGKTTVCQRLKMTLHNSVFLDGDWCWDANPFQVTEETKTMVLDNICYLLNSFLRCAAYEHVILGWVMHEQTIIDHITANLNMDNCAVRSISLVANEACLRERLLKDVAQGRRTADVVERSIPWLPLYLQLNTIKIDTSNKSVQQIVDEIKAIQ